MEIIIQRQLTRLERLAMLEKAIMEAEESGWGKMEIFLTTTR